MSESNENHRQYRRRKIGPPLDPPAWEPLINGKFRYGGRILTPGEAIQEGIPYNVVRSAQELYAREKMLYDLNQKHRSQ